MKFMKIEKTFAEEENFFSAVWVNLFHGTCTVKKEVTPEKYK